MTPRQQTLSFRLLVLALLSGLAWVGSDLVLLRVEAALGDPDEPAGPTAPRPAEEEAPAVDLEALSRRNIFNSSARPDAASLPALAEEEVGEAVAATSLNLILRGVWIGDGSKARAERGAWAIIEDPAAHTQSVYKVGDPLPGGDAQVVEIQPRAVKIRRGGQIEALGFPEAWDTSQAPGSGLAAPRGGSAGLDEVRQISPGRYQVSQRLLDYKLANLTETLTEARAIPVPGQGFRIRSIKKGSLFERIGIQNGDLLRSVNGLELTSIEQAMRAYKMLQKEPRLRLQITRGSATETLDYEIR